MTPRIDAGGIARHGRARRSGPTKQPASWKNAWRSWVHRWSLASSTHCSRPDPGRAARRSKVTQGPQASQGRRSDRLVAAGPGHSQPGPRDAAVAGARRLPGSRGRRRASRPFRLIVHRTEIAQGEGAPGEVIEAAGDRLVVAGGEGAVAHSCRSNFPGRSRPRPATSCGAIASRPAISSERRRPESTDLWMHHVYAQVNQILISAASLRIHIKTGNSCARDAGAGRSATAPPRRQNRLEESRRAGRGGTMRIARVVLATSLAIARCARLRARSSGRRYQRCPG